jgi:hypothetical protein
MEWVKLFAAALAAVLLAGCTGGQPQQSPPALPGGNGASMPPAPGNTASSPAVPQEPEPEPEQQSPPPAPETVVPQGKPDLQLQSMVLNTPISVYQIVNGTITNYNSGSAESPATKTAYYIDSELAGVVDVPPIPAGGTSIVAFTVICQSAGQHTLSGKIDYEGLIDEIDELNNGRAITFTCTG